jgi:AcrR family transcriptional regulator
MPKMSEKYLELRRSRILDAAVACFGRKGFHATTISDICREAGISHGAVYRYFPGKEKIIEATHRRDHEERVARNAVIPQEGNFREAFRSWFSGYFRRRAAAESVSITRFRMQFLGEAVRNPRMRNIERLAREDMIGGVANVIRGGQQRGVVNSDLNALAVARMLMAIADGFYVQNVMSPDIDLESCSDAVWGVFCGDFWAKAPGR